MTSQAPTQYLTYLISIKQLSFPFPTLREECQDIFLSFDNLTFAMIGQRFKRKWYKIICKPNI